MVNLITDRTQADVLLGNSKGRYDCSDLNRVESAVKKLQAQMEKLDIHLALTVKTDWKFSDTFSQKNWPVKPQMERYLQNIRILADALHVQPQLPKSMDHLDHLGANHIEQTLMAVADRIQGIRNTYKYSGELYAGEENGI